jgi:hypothetical protein
MMRTIIENLDSRNEAVDGQRELIDDIKFHGWTWKVMSATFGLAGGFTAAVFGSALTAITWLTGYAAGYGLYLHRTGTLLLVLTMPLLIFGAHCLDLQDSTSKQNSK